MPLRVSGLLVRQWQLNLRASRVAADNAEAVARGAEREAGFVRIEARRANARNQQSISEQQTAEADILQATIRARETRALATSARTGYHCLVSRAVDLESERRRLASSKHHPDEAGRYFRAALEDIVDARVSVNRANAAIGELTAQVDEYSRLAAEGEQVVGELRRKSPDSPRVIELSGIPEHARTSAEFFGFQRQNFETQLDDGRRMAFEAAQTFVAVSAANPHDPPYLTPVQVVAHQATIRAAEQVLVCECIDYSGLRGQEFEDAKRRHDRAFDTLTNLAQTSLEGFPYPQGPPGQMRTNAELDEFLRELPHPNAHDLDAENRNCAICHEPYGVNGPENGPQGNTDINGNALEDPVELPCAHIFGSRCLRTWLVPSVNTTCPICRRDLPEE